MSSKKPIVRAVDGEASPTQAEPHDENTTSAAPAQQNEAQSELLLGSDDEADGDFVHEYGRPSLISRLTPFLAALCVLAWTGFYAWAMQDRLIGAAGSAPAEWARLLIDWSIPVLLIGVIWLIAMRNSTREAARFSQSAAMLSRESAELENRLTVVNRELSLAREFLASQSRELETLGRVAAERISTHAGELQHLITANGEQVEAIGTASDTALSNMTRLRDDLPVIANSARDVNNQIASAGRTAAEQLDELNAGLTRLESSSASTNEQVDGLSERIGDTIRGFETRLERIEGDLAARFTSLQSQAEAYQGSVSDSETRALAAMNERIALLQAETRAIGATLQSAEAEAMERVRQTRDKWQLEIQQMVETLSQLDHQAAQASQLRIKELHEEAGRFDDKLKQRDVRFFEEIAQRQSTFETRETQASEALAQRLTALDDILAEKREAHAAESDKLVATGEALNAQMEQLSSLIASVKQLGDDTHKGLGEGMETLAQQLEAKRASLKGTQDSLAELTEASIRLLEIIQSGAKHSREDLPAAISTASDQLGELEQRSSKLSGAMFTMGKKGEELSSYLITANDRLGEADATLEALQEKIAAGSDEALAKLNGLRGGLERIAQDSEAFAGDTQDALIASITRLDEAAKATITALDEGARSKVTELAGTLSHEAVTALERALRNDSAQTIGKLEQAAAHASGVGREATVQLRDQLARVNELTGNLEQRISRARELAQEQVDNDFSRRMALITDSLNSASIDITKAISTEVSDTAWDAYLRGDRGIFTRRAVRLLDSGEARSVAELYQADEGFKANVNRYVHDFEAMLRSTLSTRDGNALSVTILSSDMGKLYVALAESIERFRK